MPKKSTLHIILTTMMVLLGLVLPLVPEPYRSQVARFCPALFGTVLCGILCGLFYGMLLGALVPLLSFFLYGSGTLDEALIQALTYGVTGLAAGIVYSTLRTAFGAAVTGLLSGRIAMGTANLLRYYRAGKTYGFRSFSSEALLSVWEGVLLLLIGIPVLIALFRKWGVMQALRKEKEDR